jgi:Holliday junction resolvase-like predicted endonuclease
VCIAIAAALLGARLASIRRRRTLRRCQHHGHVEEKKAATHLSDMGYTIIETHPVCTQRFFINRHAVDYRLVPDYRVHKGGRTAIVEVKTGKDADVANSARIRRQLFEYARFFPRHRILLYDAEHKRLHRIRFPGIAAPRRGLYIFLYIVAVILGILTGWWLGMQ